MAILSFNINRELKSKLKKNIIKNNKKYEGLFRFKNAFRVIVFAIPSVFLIYAYSISGRFIQLNDFYAPVGTKNHLFIWTCAITTFVILLFLYFIIRMIYNGLASKTINDRFDESLVYENHTLSYGYKLKMQSYIDERIVVRIPLETTEYHIDEESKKIIFRGSLFSQFYTNYTQGEINGKGDYIPEIVLYDYFEPSLISFLVNNKNTNKGVQ